MPLSVDPALELFEKESTDRMKIEIPSSLSRKHDMSQIWLKKKKKNLWPSKEGAP